MKRFNYDPDKKWIVHDPDGDVNATDLCIIAEMHDKGTYYSIRYITEDGVMHIGWSSYKLEIVFEFLEQYFDMVEEGAVG